MGGIFGGVPGGNEAPSFPTIAPHTGSPFQPMMTGPSQPSSQGGGQSGGLMSQLDPLGLFGGGGGGSGGGGASSLMSLAPLALMFL